MTHDQTCIFSAIKISYPPHTHTHHDIFCLPQPSLHSYVSYVHLTIAASPPPASQFSAVPIICYFHFYLYSLTFFCQVICMIKTFPDILCVLHVYRKMLLLVFSLDRKKSLPLTELFHGCQKCKLLITGNSGTGIGNFGVRINVVMLNITRVAMV